MIAAILPAGWRPAQLKGHIQIKHGFAFKSEYFGASGPFALLTPGNFYDEGGFKQQGEKQKRYDGPVKDTFILSAGDLVVAMTEQAEGLLGSSAVIPSTDTYLHNQRIGLVTAERLDSRFLYYLFNHRPIRNQISSSASGTKVRHTSPARIGEVRFARPPLDAQRRIAGILSAYDDLIEVNTHRIAILEEMASRLFEEWFIQLRFPGRGQLAGTASFPKEWKSGTLSEVLTVLESGSRPKGGVGAEGDIPSIGAENIIGLGKYDYTKEKMITTKYFRSMRRGHVQNRDVMLYKDGAYIGRLSMAWRGFPHTTCVVNEHVFLLRTIKEIPSQFLFLWLSHPDLQAKIRSLNANAAQPGLNQPGIRGLPIIIPPAVLLARFDEITTPVLDLLFNLAIQIPRLRELTRLIHDGAGWRASSRAGTTSA